MLQASESQLQTGLTAFIKGCVLSERKERYQYLFASQKGRKKWLQKLDHFQEALNIDTATALNSSLTSKEIVQLLGVPASSESLCFSVLRGAESGLVADIATLIEYTWGSGCGSIICTLNSERPLHLYFGEEKQAQYLFKQT